MAERPTEVWQEPSRGECVDPVSADVSGLEYARSFMEGRRPAPPIARLTGRRIVDADVGRATFALPATGWLVGPKGRVLNSALVFLAHAPSWVAVLSSLPRRTMCIMAELSMTFLGEPPFAGTELLAKGELIYADAHNGLAEVFTTDSAGRLLAHSTARCFVYPPAPGPPAQPEASKPASPHPVPDDAEPDPYLRPVVGSSVPEEVFRSWSGLDILTGQIRGDLPRAPIAYLTGLRPVDAGDGRAAFVLPATGWLRSEAGTVFGGAIGLLANSAAAAAVQTVAAPGESFTALDVKVNFLRQVSAEGGDMAATGKVVHRGRRLVISTAEVVDAGGHRVAIATGTTMLDASRMPVNDT